MIYANSTYFGNGFVYGGGAQEQSFLRDMDPVTVCHLIGKNLISKKVNGNYIDLMYESAVLGAHMMLLRSTSCPSVVREPTLSPVIGFLLISSGLPLTGLSFA